MEQPSPSNLERSWIRDDRIVAGLVIPLWLLPEFAGDSLSRRIGSWYDVAVHRVFPAGFPFEIHLMLDTNLPLDRITPEAFSRDERLPYRAEVWSLSIAFAGFGLQTVFADCDRDGRTSRIAGTVLPREE